MGRFSRAIYRCTHPHMLRSSIKHADVVSIKHAESCCFPFWRHIETYTSQIMDFQSIHILSTLCERHIKYLLLLLFALFVTSSRRTAIKSIFRWSYFCDKQGCITGALVTSAYLELPMQIVTIQSTCNQLHKLWGTGLDWCFARFFGLVCFLPFYL